LFEETLRLREEDNVHTQEVYRDAQFCALALGKEDLAQLYSLLVQIKI